MKNKCFKFLCVMLCAAACMSAFPLAACTDDEPTPRKLDSVEQSIVANKWCYLDETRRIYTFCADGTFHATDDYKGTFEHIGDGTDDERGHYEIIYLRPNGNPEDQYAWKQALFDDESEYMYRITDDGFDTLSYFHRIIDNE